MCRHADIQLLSYFGPEFYIRIYRLSNIKDMPLHMIVDWPLVIGVDSGRNCTFLFESCMGLFDRGNAWIYKGGVWLVITSGYLTIYSTYYVIKMDTWR